METKNLFSQGALWRKLQTSYPQGNARVTSGSFGTQPRLFRDTNLKGSARVAHPMLIFLRYAAVFLLIFTLGVGNVWGTDETLTESEIKTNFTSSAHSYGGGAKSYTDGDITWYLADFTATANSKWFQLKKDQGVYLQITSPENTKITSLTLTVTSASNSSGGAQDISMHTAYSGRLALLTADATGSPSMEGVGYTTSISNNSATITVSGTNRVLYLKTSAAARIWGASVTYQSTGGGYSITYHCNDATSDCPSNASGQSALPNPLPTPSKTGFTFGGWYTDAALTTAASAGASLSGNVDLYAKWTCNVTLNRNGATETINNVVEETALNDIDGTGAQGGCSAWTFVGWSKTQRAAQNNTSAMTLVTTVDGAGPYYAVYSHTESGGAVTWTQVTSVAVDDEVVIAEIDHITTDNTIGNEMTGFYTTTTTSNNYGTYASISTNPAGTMVWKVEAGNSTGEFSFKNGDYYLNLGSDNNYLNGSTTKNANSSWTVETSSSRAVVTNAQYTSRKIMWNQSYPRFASYAKNHGNNSGSYYYHIVFYKKSGGSTTYYSTTATCCTPLGSINGSISLTTDGCGAGELKATWKMSATTGIASQTLKIFKSSDDSEVTAKRVTGLTASTSNQTQTISGLDPCETYYVKVENVSSGNPYCEGGVIGTSSTATTLGYTLTVSKTNCSISSGEEPARICSNVSVTYSASAGYALPTSITVSNAGAQNTGWAWNSGTGVLTINKANVTGNVSVTITPTCVTPSITVHPASKTDYLVDDTGVALSVTASAAGASLGHQWQVSDDNSSWDDIAAGDGGTAATYTPSTADAGTKYYRVIVSNAASGCSTTATSNAATITVTAPSGYCISAFNSSNNGIINGFNNGGSGNEYTLSYTIPGKDGSSNWPQYWVGENDAWSGTFSANAYFADMKVTTCNATIGLAQGATGKLHIWDDNKASGSNLWVKFEPDGYGLRWGGAGEWDQAANTKAFTVDAGDANVYWTDIVTLDGTNNTAWNYYVGLQTASGYVYSGVDDEANDGRGISRTRSVTAMKVSNGTSGSWKATYLNSEPTGSRGKFRIWNNNITDYNFVCHWVPFYRVTYNGNGASGSTSPSADVCCEGNAAARTVVAAANGFDAPTGKQFGGWATSAENAAAKTVAYAAGANIVLTADVELFPVWNDIDYTVTVNQSPNVSATTTGQTSTAHYNTTINLTTTVPSGYRFVNWTSSDVVITDNTSATTASFTMPNSNVTVTANFQQTHSISWYVGGTAEGNKLTTGSQTTVVDHGGSISTLPSTPDGSPCDKTFQGWTNTTSYTHGTSPLYTAVGDFPAINADASFYAVFATGGTPSTKSLTNSEITSFYCNDNNCNPKTTAYDNGPFTITSTDGDWYGVCAAGTNPNSVNIRFNTATISGVATRPYLQSPVYSGDIASISITHNCGQDRTLLICSSTIDDLANDTLATISATSSNKSGVSANLPSGVSQVYLYSTEGAIPIQSITATVGGYSGHTLTCADCGTSVTLSYTASPTGGTVAVTKSGSAAASGSTFKTCNAFDLSVRVTPDTHYDLTHFRAKIGTTSMAITPDTSTVLPKSSVETFTVTVPANANGTLTLTPIFAAQTPLTITLNTNNKGTFTPIGDVYSGESFTFPTVTPADGECASFLGWIEGTTFSGDGTETDPTAITGLAEYHAASTSSGALTTNKTYTAVFGEKDTRDAPAYERVEAAPTPPATWDGDHYLIVYEGDATHDAVAFDGRRDNDAESYGLIDATENSVEVSISDGKIAKTDRLAAAEWKIATITDGYSIRSASGYYIGRKSTSSNGMDVDASTAKLNTLAYSSSSFSVTGEGGKVLKYNKTDGQLRFRYLTSGEDIQLYKLNANAQVVTYTYTTNPACTPRYRVTVNDATGGSPSSDKTYEHAGETITLTAHPAAGYSFTSWAMVNTDDGTDNLTALLSSTITETATFTLPAKNVTVTATYAKIYVSSVVAKEGETTLNTSDNKLNINTGANKTVTVVVTPANAYDHSWSAEVTSGGTYASISNVTDNSFRVNGLAQGDATIVVTAPNDDGTDRTATFTVHVTDVLPEEIILKRDGSVAEIETLTMYYDVANSQGQYVKVNVSYSPSNPTNKRFSTTNNVPTKTSTIDAPVAGYTTIHALGLTGETPATITFTSVADGSVTKVLTVTVLPILTDTFVDYIQGQATQIVSARLSNDRYDIITDINTPSLTDASDANPTSEDCKTAHYHLIGWLPKATAEALWAAGTPITEATEGLERAGASIEASGQTWYAIWAKETATP